MRMKLFFGIALACAINSALADDTVYYLVSNEGGYAYTAAFTNAALWTTTATKDKGFASGGAGASLDGDKVFGIQGSKTLNTIETDEIPAVDAVFTGKRLECGTGINDVEVDGVKIGKGGTGRIRQFTHGEAKTSWDNWGAGEGLKLYRGYYITGKDNVTSHIYGKMEVINYGTAIWEFYIHNPGAFLHFHSDISSAPKGTGGTTKNFKITSDKDGGGIFFSGSLADFYGDILSETTDGCAKTIGFGTTTLASRLQLCENSTLTTVTAEDVFKVGKLECDRIAGVDVKMALPETGAISSGQIVVTNSVSVANGPVVLKTSYEPVTNENANATLKPLVFGKGVSFSPSDFVWTPKDEAQKAAISASYVSEEDGSTSLALNSGALVKQTVSDSIYVQVSTGSGYRDVSITNASHWSDGRLPHAGAHYLVSAGNSASFALRTQADAMTLKDAPFEPIDYTFPGESLSIGNKSYFIVGCSNVTVKLLRMFGGSNFIQAQFTRATLNGTLSIEGDTTWHLYFSQPLTVKSEIVGDGEVRLVTANAASPIGQMLLDNTNTNFTGRIRVSQTDALAPVAGFSDTNQTLFIKDGRALGGAGFKFDPKALTLERYGSLCALESTSISEPTRGMWINGVGRVKVESGKTLVCSSPLAVYGTFCKEGSGLFALGNGQPAFGETALDATPDASAANRTFLIREGNVKVTNAYALNGLDVVMEDPESVIVLDAETTDATLSTYGIVNVLTPGMPFAVSGEATKIKIGFSCASEPTWGTKTLAICTVKKEHADAVESLLQKVKFNGGFRLSIASIDPVAVVMNGEECVTFMAKVVSRFGTVISFR